MVGAVGTRLEDSAFGGMHRRVTTAHGPLHVWTPRHYSESGDLVVYVHGNHVDVDTAWNDQQLVKQFAASGLDAMFIACEAPSAEGEPVKWASLAELLGTTKSTTKLELPMGRVIVVGHSAAHRTVVPWMAESQLDRLVMIDSIYGDVERYRDWLGEQRDRQLIFVGGASTRPWTDQLHGLLPEATVLAELPALGQARAGRVVYVKSEIKQELMDGDAVLPVLPVLLQMASDDAGTPVARM